MASDRHMEAGRDLWLRCLNDGTPDAGMFIAEALANAERDGMKRAAEIVGKTFHSGTDIGNRWRRLMRQSILSEAGEG